MKEEKEQKNVKNEEEFIQNIREDIRNKFKTCGYPLTGTEYRWMEEMVPMRDGICLQTMICMPTEKKQQDIEEQQSVCQKQEMYPVILQRTCYPMWDFTMRLYGEELAKRGYVYIYQYCRGIAGSEGEWEPNIHERNDGIDTVIWIRRQSWTGSLGVWGNSYGSLIGWAMADAVKGIVDAMCIGVYGCDRFISAYQKGAFRHDILTSWTMENAGFPITTDYLESCRYMPQAEVDEQLWGKRIDWYRDYILNSSIQDEYWQSGWWKQLREIPAKVEIPLYITSGWYDHHHGSTMATWERLSEKAKNHSWLEIGGWNHMQFSCLEDKEVENNCRNEVKNMLQWFELTLIQKKFPERMIRLYEIGKDRWREVQSLDELKTSEEKYYLQVNAQGEKQLGKEALPQAAVSYVYDPGNPVMSHGSEALLKTMNEVGSLLQPEPDWREDVKSFLSEPLEKELCIFGKIKVNLYVVSDCEDTAFTAKVMEVDSNGKAYNIRSSITTISKDTPQAENYVPGTPRQVTVEMWDILSTLSKGSRLRVDISSSDFPQYNIHSNYAGNWAQQKKSRVAHQQILCGEKYPSALMLPVINN